MSNPSSISIQHQSLPVRIVNELLFWLHLAVFLVLAGSPFYAPLWAVVIGFVIYQLHLIVFQGCIISSWQRRLGGLAEGQDWYQAAAKRFFGYHLSPLQTFWLSRAVEYYVLTTAVIVYLVKH